MKNLSFKRIGGMYRLMIRETSIIEYFSPAIATLILILMSGFINDNWQDRMEDIVMIALSMTCLAAVTTPFSQLISQNGPLTKMILPASYMEKYLAGWAVAFVRCIYGLAGVAVSLAIFIGIAVLTGTEGIPHTAQELTVIVMAQEPLVLALLVLPPIITVFTIATATTRKVKVMTYVVFSIEILAVFGLGSLENTYPDGELPMWMNITFGSIFSIVPIIWSYVILKYVQPKRTDDVGNIF